MRMLIIALLGVLAGSCADPAAAAACVLLPGGAAPAGASLQDCVDRTPSGGRLELSPGTYRLTAPLLIARPISIATAGLAAGAAGCAALSAGRCATLRVALEQEAGPRATPILVQAEGVSLSHLIVEGAGQNRAMRGWCGEPETRPSGGGIRVMGSGFSLRKSVLRHFTCYTALEVTASAKAPVIEDNRVGPNGDHRPGEVWSDGVTIHDSQSAIIRRNLFVDNSDVQLILGGCRDCQVEDNRFVHGGAFDGASFAELMLHSFPNTSGDFAGTLVRGNAIDCGPARRCGYGLMIGSAPWHPGRMSGGRISGNVVRNALVGINIDALTGPVEVDGNRVAGSGGRFASDCGTRDWPAVSVAPSSRSLVKGDPSDRVEGSVRSAGCILNRQPHPAR